MTTEHEYPEYNIGRKPNQFSKQAIEDLARKLVEYGQIEYFCSLCDSWSTRDPFEAKEHNDLMNKGKAKTSQWYHVIEASRK
jgi:hypothetical protein